MSDQLTNYYNDIQKNGKLPTTAHASRWSSATLKTLGVNLDKKVKKELSQALPDPLDKDLYGVFWLAHFRNTQLSKIQFQNDVARRAGNSDKQFARYPITAVFAALKTILHKDLCAKVASDLAPELRELWDAS